VGGLGNIFVHDIFFVRPRCAGFFFAMIRLQDIFFFDYDIICSQGRV
jgi:hypothetical protein